MPERLHQEIRRILIVRTDRIGDVILTLPMAQALKQHLPSAYISMLIRNYTSEIVRHHPAVDHTIFYDDQGQPLSVMQLVGILRKEHFDVVFHTNPRFRVAFMTWLAGIPIRVGTGYRWYSFLFNRKVYEHRKDARYHELEYNLHLLKAIECPVNADDVTPTFEVKPHDVDGIREFLRQRGIPDRGRIILLHPGSGGSAREWSAGKFGELGDKLANLPDVSIIVTGGKGEEKLVDEVVQYMEGRCNALVNVLNLSELAALAKISSLFIANSTGPIHLAAAVGTPVIGLYSHLIPLSATRWGPYTNNKVVFSPRQVPPDCRQCTGERNSSCACMDTITVDEVFQGAKTLLSRSEPEVLNSDVHLQKSK